MSNKLINIICLSLCAAGVGLYLFAYISKANLEKSVKTAKSNISKLDSTLRANQTNIATGLLDLYSNEIKQDVEESKRISAFFERYGDKLGLYFESLGEPKDWKDKFEGVPVPRPNLFKIAYTKGLKDELTKKYKAILNEEAPKFGALPTGVSPSLADIHQLKVWKQKVPKATELLKAMRRYNIAHSLLKSASLVNRKAQLKVQSMSASNYLIDKNKGHDFNSMTVTFVCKLIHRHIPELINKVLTNTDLLFEVEGVEMNIPKVSLLIVEENPKEEDPEMMEVTLSLRVLDVKKATVKDRNATVKIVKDIK